MKKLFSAVLVLATIATHAKAQTPSIDSIVNAKVTQAVSDASVTTTYNSTDFVNTGTAKNQNLSLNPAISGMGAAVTKASSDAANAVTQATNANVTLAQLTARVVVIEGKLPAMQTTINTQASQIATLTTQLNAATAANTTLTTQLNAITARLNAATVTATLKL